ncbi:MAG: hypothetical protein JHC98_10005 [Thermoleophilaceae bacterium]|nr:hypothetical protein [Thermoleophilaceae bacterium]
MTKPITFIVLFLVGALVMFVFDNTFTLFIGMFLQLAAVGIGVFAIATPGFLDADGDAASTPQQAAGDDA